MCKNTKIVVNPFVYIEPQTEDTEGKGLLKQTGWTLETVYYEET